MELTRLLALVRLSPPQALEVGAGLLTGAASRRDPSVDDAPSDVAVPDRTIVSTDGQVVLCPERGRNGRPQGKAATDAALATVLADIAGAARLRGRTLDPADEQLLTALDRAAAELPDSGVPAVATRLEETAAAGIDRTAVRGELAALVRAVGDRAASAGGPAPVGGRSIGGRAAPARRITARERRIPVRRIGAWLLSVVVLATGVVVEVAVLRDDIAADIALLLDAGRGGAASSPEPEPDGVPIEAPAPAAAGSVAAVDLRPLARCAPAAPCTLRLQVGLVPGPGPQVVTWSYRLVDRCTGAAVEVPGGTVTAPAGGQRVVAVGTVALPDQQAVAVIAVTSLPAVAASAPVSAGSCLPAEPTG